MKICSTVRNLGATLRELHKLSARVAAGLVAAGVHLLVRTHGDT